MKLLNFYEGVEIINLQHHFTTSFSCELKIVFRLSDDVDVYEVIDRLYKCTDAKRIHTIFDISDNRKILEVLLYD